MNPLDNPVWHALTGPQVKVAEGDARAVRYQPDFSVFAGLPDAPDEASWAALARMSAGPALLLPPLEPGPGWSALGSFAVHQMVFDRAVPPPKPGDGDRAVELGPDDLAELTALVTTTAPGPWAERTHELGRFFGVRIDGVLVAAAGQRMRLPDAVEISAVCTDEAHRGRGLGAVATMAVLDAILADGALPFLHVRDGNASAIAMYERLGFSLRTTLPIGMYQPPTNA